MEVRNIYYSEFGAVGDGKTNDFEAIKSCHDYANEHGATVNADKGKTYYIGKTGGVSVSILTDVNWTDATFIIDDLSFECEERVERTCSIFVVKSEYDLTQYAPGEEGEIPGILKKINENGGLRTDSFKKFDLGLGYPALVTIVNTNHKNYIRYKSHYASAQDQKEMVLIDADGNVDPCTPLMFDYGEITSIVINRVDDKRLTLTGGTFITKANKVPFAFNESGSPIYNYYYRNIVIKRSNTVLQNLTHVIEGERTDCGAPYSGFITVRDVNNVLVQNSTVQAHRNYNNMGSYDISPGNANNITFKNVIQTNFFLEDGKTVSVGNGYWGVMGSNYCKNLTYDSCKLTRFDAHCGAYNGTIINSDVAVLSLIGAGTMRIENSRIHRGSSANVIGLRSDYGSTWNGDIIFKNVRLMSDTKCDTVSILNANWGNWDFGYKTYVPSVYIENFTCESESVKTVKLLSGGAESSGDISQSTVDGAENLNPCTPPKEFVIKNNLAGYTYTLGTSEFLAKTELRIEE